MIIPRPPASIRDTFIFQRLRGEPDDPDGLQSKALRFMQAADPLLDSIIAGPFRTYTLHNRDHARKLVHLAQYITSRDTLDTLTSFECLLIIYSSYLHDMGLALSHEDATRILSSDDYQDTIRSWPQLQTAIDAKRAQLLTSVLAEQPSLELELADLHAVALTQYLRPLHATSARYRSLLSQIRSGLPGDDPFQIRGISFEDELLAICESHNLDAAVLGQLTTAHEDRFPRRFAVADHTANLQFIAAILRLTDILDFDFERTPRVLFESLGLRHRHFPGAEVSLQEWERHLAVQQLDIRDAEIVVIAQCNHPSIEASVRQFCLTIEDEIRSTISVARRNDSDIADRYRFRLPTTVRPEIRSRGYKFLDLALNLVESSVMTLLMGVKLYETPYAAVRELIQNAIDACVVRQHLRPDLGRPHVLVYPEVDAEQRVWLCFRDHGIGMTQHVLSNYFFRVGKSYYLSSDFDRLLRGAAVGKLHLISRFGIGFLASFMLADLIEIETRPVALSPHFPEDTGLRIAVERLGALAYVQESEALPTGTTVRLRLKRSIGGADDAYRGVLAYLNDNFLRPEVPVTARFPARTLEVTPGEFYALRPRPLPHEGLPPGVLHPVSIDLDRFSQQFRGRVFLFFARDAESGSLDVRYGDRLLEFGVSASKNRIHIDPLHVFKDFRGNRVTVGGFRMNFTKLGRLLRYGDTILPSVYDLDLVPTSNVNFDVARRRILDENVALRLELRRAIKTALMDNGTWDRLVPGVRRLVEVRSSADPFALHAEHLRQRARLITDDELLEQVRLLIPNSRWPSGLHRAIADQLGITPQLASRAITTLIVEGRVTNPPNG